MRTCSPPRSPDAQAGRFGPVRRRPVQARVAPWVCALCGAALCAALLGGCVDSSDQPPRLSDLIEAQEADRLRALVRARASGPHPRVAVPQVPAPCGSSRPGSHNYATRGLLARYPCLGAPVQVPGTLNSGEGPLKINAPTRARRRR